MAENSMENSRFRLALNRTFQGFEKENNIKWKGPFTFVQAADTQYGLINELRFVDWTKPLDEALAAKSSYLANNKVVWNEEMRLASKAIEQWNSLVPRPRFAIICGDLVNDFPGEEYRESQIKDFLKTFESLSTDIPLVLLPGNHDIGNTPTEDTIERYRAVFGDDYFSFWIDGVMFIVINVQYHKDRSQVQTMAKEHDVWLDKQLNDAKINCYKHVIVFQHVPWFLHDINEPDDIIFNITLEERKRMVAKFEAAGVRAIFAGHYHRNAGGHYQNMELIVTSAMGAVIGDKTTGSGYRIVQVNDDSVQHKFVEIE